MANEQEQKQTSKQVFEKACRNIATIAELPEDEVHDEESCKKALERIFAHGSPRDVARATFEAGEAAAAHVQMMTDR
ncbi:hypothetical protein [uncultured Victivallis sp.]|uniref:hypothetical protein n=1 Tax=uncultured Victivallis sp. TaxID=354118 RepID=UPI002591DD52|nr:hypothetical protein [uncultured Victivallis sp.]